MTAPPRAGPPLLPLQSRGWPARRYPRWLLPALAVLVAAAVAVGLAHRPSRQERAADLRGLLHTLNYDIESCAGGVHDSLTVLTAIDSGTSHDVATAASVAGTGTASCSPASNELIDDLESYQVPESLASYHLGRAVTGLIDWAAPDAENAQSGVARVLAARGTPREAAARAALRQALRTLDRQRAAVDTALAPAIAALSPRAAPPALPG
ncbi:MAG TPA: hypothetical protein VFV41_13085 [Streptosporangiaceae bacterium]|nr:hypothetical protein [Streptosporangiaceae bacterium]